MLQLIKTADGSDTIFNSALNETYHSVHGALTESQHVFIKHGLQYCLGKEAEKLKVLEVGMGTGLNLLLTWLYVKNNACAIHYTAVEPFPLTQELLNSVNYVKALMLDEQSRKQFNFIHDCSFKETHRLSEKFSLLKIREGIEEAAIAVPVDLVYFDAFGPGVQPEMWTSKVFEKIGTVMKPGACLVTYCAKGEVKRTLKAIGFRVDRLPGPPGKLEMTRAIKL